MPRAGNLPYTDTDRSKSIVVFQCVHLLDLCQNSSLPESFWMWLETLMRLSEDRLINRNCRDMPAVIPKILNLLKMEIRASIVALAFPGIYPWFSLNWDWNILTGSIRRTPVSKHLGTQAGQPQLIPSQSQIHTTHCKAGNACRYLIKKKKRNAVGTRKCQHQKQD